MGSSAQAGEGPSGLRELSIQNSAWNNAQDSSGLFVGGNKRDITDSYAWVAPSPQVPAEMGVSEAGPIGGDAVLIATTSVSNKGSGKKRAAEGQDGYSQPKSARTSANGLRRRIITSHHNSMGPNLLALRPSGTDVDSMEQMAQISAKLPTDADEKIVKGEKKMILTSMERFKGRLGNVTENDTEFKIQGLTMPLKPLQFATSGWIMARELSKSKKLGNGGIVAHDMGLGKTVMVLASLVGSRVGLAWKGPVDCNTLVVVPNDECAREWMREVAKHCSESFGNSMFQFKNAYMIRDVRELQGFSLVFITYSELLSSWKRNQELLVAVDQLGDSDTKTTGKDLIPSPIYQAKWYRVVLDEGHTIKNHASRTAAAVFNIQKNHGWFLTGTPLSNTANELFPYFKFLGVEHSDNLAGFRRKYFDKEKPNDQLQDIMTAVMQRKEIDGQFSCRKLLDLPPRHEGLQKVVLSGEESTIYRFLQERMIKRVNDDIQDGNCESKLPIYLHFLLLLRQAAIHPFFFENLFLEDMASEELGDLRNHSSMGDVDRLTSSEKLKSPSLGKLLALVTNNRRLKDEGCVGCANKGARLAGGAMAVLPCNHLLCQACGVKRTSRSTLRCKRCKQVYPREKAKNFSTLGFPLEESDTDSDSESEFESEADTPNQSTWGDSPGKGTKKGRGRPRPQYRRPGEDSKWRQPMNDAGLRFLTYTDKQAQKEDMFLSSKFIALRNQLRQWRSEAPDDKIIVFTQFILCSRLVGRVAEREGIKFLYYSGHLNGKERLDALKTFHDDPDTKLLISSLKCGGQALNITCANRVILMELWWNRAMEEQAFSRVYRMGQEKECYLVRLCAANTIDEEMMDLQKSKMNEVQDCLLSRHVPNSGMNLHSILAFIGKPVYDPVTKKLMELKRREEDEEEISRNHSDKWTMESVNNDVDEI